MLESTHIGYILTKLSFAETRIEIIQGDITEQDADAIVNAANSSLMGGGGVDGAIHRRGGISILRECEKIRATQFPNGLPTGKTVITSGGNLKARFVIHTVGPIWSGSSESEHLLRECYTNSLSLAKSKGLKSVAFPAISTGAFGYPMKPASRVALEAVKDFLDQNKGSAMLELITFVLFSSGDLRIYEDMAKTVFKTKGQ